MLSLAELLATVEHGKSKRKQLAAWLNVVTTLTLS
jgi:hypothetical protein